MPRARRAPARGSLTQRADEIARARQVVIIVWQPRQPEIGDPEVVTVIDQQIRRLDVAMNHTDLVGMLERKAA